MNMKIRVALLFMSLMFALCAGEPGRTVMPASPANPPQTTNSIAAFWEKFKAAVIRGDKETVATLSRFPISRGYGMGSLRTKTQFLKRYREVFFGETDAAKCFPNAKPLVDKERPKEFTISCSFASSSDGGEPFEYGFTLTRNGWRFTAFENSNE
jgi:hypothetical protein